MTCGIKPLGKMNLEGRCAQCAYAGRCPTFQNLLAGKRNAPTGASRDELITDGEPVRLPFFRYQPDMEYDAFYDGCFGWD